ncbi:hypothetical protein IRL25_004035 [Salmonella enterica]|nr:hypothetical protein [Salmonella enterica]EGL7634709.1 hypothetical protein [Salmonella enterica]EGL8402703.1 hypothetical protein [Salmonella enterica]EGL8449457.1 hypothetical protein [Salmonella enterica]EGL8485875.1 hypothetical protein [Salmonella enterica]
MPNFKPLDGSSQAHGDNVFYFDKNASDKALTDNAMNRIYNLMNLCADIGNLPADSQVSVCYLSAVSTYLLSDAYSLLTELSDRQMKNQGGSDKALIDQIDQIDQIDRQAKAIIALTEIIGKNARAKDEQGGEHE